jgi:CarD family transcriptional regulator
MIFELGDKVVHPAYGGGEITAIREKSFLNHSNQYYEIRVTNKNMTVMVPVAQAQDLGIRRVSNTEALSEMWEILAKTPEELSNAYQERQDGIKERIRTGDFLEIARALRDLAGRQGDHKLTQADKGLVDQAEAFLASELALSLSITMEEAKRKIRLVLSEA